MFQPCVHCGPGDASRGLPAGAPAFAQFVNVAICSEESDGSLENFPNRESANHGGINLAFVICRILAAYGRTSRYETSGMGAISPLRWQLWQCCWKMGWTSL